jgi:proteasome activator-like protein
LANGDCGRVGTMEHPEAVPPAGASSPEPQDAVGAMPPVGAIDPARLLRIASVTREVLDEARRIRPEPGAVEHLKRLHEQITRELKEALPPDLYAELDELTPDLRSGSLEELGVAHAEILGWLQGLFQGTQLALQMRAMRPPQLPDESQGSQEQGQRETDARYL